MPEQNRLHRSQKDTDHLRNHNRPGEEPEREDGFENGLPKSELGFKRIENADHSTRQTQMNHLQRTLGNSVVSRYFVQRRPRRKQTITFGPGEGDVVTGDVRDLGPNQKGVDVTWDIGNCVESLKTCFNLLGTNYIGGIESFRDYMSFTSSGEAKADYLKAALKFGLKETIDQLLGASKELLKDFPAWKIAFEVTEGLVKALIDEHERAAKDQEQVVVRDYIVVYRDKALKQISSIMLTLDPLKKSLLEDYDTAVRSQAGGAKLGTPTVTRGAKPRVAISGPGALFLNKLHKDVASLRSLVAQRTSDFYLKRILEAWVRTHEGSTESKGGGEFYAGGSIHLTYNLLHNRGNWTVQKVPTKAKLAAPQANRTIDALHRVMQERNININQLEILKELTIVVEDEVPWAANDYYYVHVRYRSPDQIDHVHTVPSPVREKQIRKIPQMEAGALGHVKLDALNVRSLEEY